MACLTVHIPYFIKNKIADGASRLSAWASARRSSPLEYHTVSLCTCKRNLIYVREINTDSEYSLAPHNEVAVNDISVKDV